MAALIRDLLLDCDLAILPRPTDGPDRQRESLVRFFRFWQQTHRETLELLLKTHRQYNSLAKPAEILLPLTVTG